MTTPPSRLLPAGPVSLAEHLDSFGPPPFSYGSRLIAEVERAGLTGRGGAAFPAARKMRAVAEAGRRAGALHSQVGTVVVGNGAESEPASSKDRLLMSRAPHLVLDGIALAAEAVGATRAYLCVHDGDALRQAVTNRERAGLNRVPIQVVQVPAGYLTSQETALVSVINGGRPVPTFSPPRPAERGAHRRPTLVQNVETLAQLALIARFGADWFRAAGSAEAPGSRLVTVTGAVARPGVFEVPGGAPLASLLELAGGPAEPPLAVLAGGLFGGWLPMPAVPTLRLSEASLRPAGAAVGPGVLMLLPESACPLAETARIAGYLAGQNAGQCGPCRNGLPALAAALDQIAFGQPGPDVLQAAHQLTRLVSGRGACHLPDGAAGLITSALRVFQAEVGLDAADGPCGRVDRDPVLEVPDDRG